MSVSLLSYCQYPTVKTIGKDTVVIMTVKQGDDINNRFISLNDSIKALGNNVKLLSDSISVKKDIITSLDLSLTQTKSQLLVTEEEIKRLNDLIIKNEKTHMSERRSWAGWMLFSIFTIVVVGAMK